jgi:hypothetical protein
MEENKTIEKIKEKFPRIFKKGESSPRNPIELNLIYEEIKNSKKPLRIREISERTKFKINSVRGYIQKYLERESYVKKDKKYTPPYLMITPHNGDPEFIYGKDKRDNKIEDEKDILKKCSNKINEKQIESIIKIEIYNSNFFKLWDVIVSELWKQKDYSVDKMRIGSGANRYIV